LIRRTSTWCSSFLHVATVWRPCVGSASTRPSRWCFLRQALLRRTMTSLSIPAWRCNMRPNLFRSVRKSGFSLLGFYLCLGAMASGSPAAEVKASANGGSRLVDLSLLVDSSLPCTWPANFAPFHINQYLRIGRHSPYNSDLLLIDENTGTQFDAPAHSIPPP